MKRVLQLLLFVWCTTALGDPPETYTWSSTACPKCQSTIVYQAWYPDRSPLVAEGMAGTNAGALVALALEKDTMVVSLGLRIAQDPLLTLDLRQNVTIETDSSPHMILYAKQEAGAGFRKDDVAVLRELNSHSLLLRPQVPASGFLFFPFDPRAGRFVVVVKVGPETFRFPFVQDPEAPAKFGDPARFASRGSSSLPPRTCTRNVSFVVSEDGRLVPRAPDFAGKWLERNALSYPGLCFSQVPVAHIPNYLVAFAPSAAAFDELHPSLSGGEASTAPSGRPTAAIWTYHAAETPVSLDRTATYVGVDYLNKAKSLFAYTYDQTGRLLSRRERLVTTRLKGSQLESLGEGLAAAVAAHSMKERLLEDAVHDLTQQ